jgi:hypothetical protein
MRSMHAPASWPGLARWRHPHDAIFLFNRDQSVGEIENLRHKHPAVADELLSLIGRWEASLARP